MKTLLLFPLTAGEKTKAYPGIIMILSYLNKKDLKDLSNLFDE